MLPGCQCLRHSYESTHVGRAEDVGASQRSGQRYGGPCMSVLIGGEKPNPVLPEGAGPCRCACRSDGGFQLDETRQSFGGDRIGCIEDRFQRRRGLGGGAAVQVVTEPQEEVGPVDEDQMMGRRSQAAALGMRDVRKKSLRRDQVRPLSRCGQR